jgi:hypothetical protein
MGIFLYLCRRVINIFPIPIIRRDLTGKVDAVGHKREEPSSSFGIPSVHSRDVQVFHTFPWKRNFFQNLNYVKNLVHNNKTNPFQHLLLLGGHAGKSMR